jgi:hypothetical protein
VENCVFSCPALVTLLMFHIKCGLLKCLTFLVFPCVLITTCSARLGQYVPHSFLFSHTALSALNFPFYTVKIELRTTGNLINIEFIFSTYNCEFLPQF